ncbi:LOW QUALITY PROTEIN: protein LEG1 homolog [Trichechus inunguis]
MAFLLSWTCVIVGCLSASLAVTSNLSDLYPPLWVESPGQFSDYRMKDGQYIINAWVYPQRMGMYKILLTQTARYFERFAPENEQNVLWGLPLQHGWQYHTGRLADPTHRTNCGYESRNHLCISVDSWWADLNYFLCALPFLAAVDSGVMGISSDQVTLLPPLEDQNLFCLNVSTCRLSFPQTMNNWNTFYQHLKLPSSTFEDLLKYLRAAHTTTLKDTLQTFEYKFNNYLKPEVFFMKSWSVSVEYIAASNFPTTLIRTHGFRRACHQMLITGDVVPFISDFTALQNTMLFSLNNLHKVDNATGTLSLTVWKNLMKTQFARKLVLTDLAIFLKLFNSTLIKMIKK